MKKYLSKFKIKLYGKLCIGLVSLRTPLLISLATCLNFSPIRGDIYIEITAQCPSSQHEALHEKHLNEPLASDSYFSSYPFFSWIAGCLLFILKSVFFCSFCWWFIHFAFFHPAPFFSLCFSAKLLGAL